MARGITLVENDSARSERLLNSVARKTGRAFVVGVTGPPGTGKSTLVDRLIEEYRKAGVRVGVVAVDPTSPLSGGALLGDRIRMSERSTDRGVYIRSMATRGWSGGLARSTAQVIQLMDAAGIDVILLETVGIGQSDIEVMRVAHAVLVVVMPGMGDDIQVSKAGLMEIGDIYVVNKSDIPGADGMVVNLLSMVRTRKRGSPYVLKVSAAKRQGLDRLFDTVESLRRKFRTEGDEMKLNSIRGMVVEIAKGRLLDRFGRFSGPKVDALASRVLAGKMTVNEAADRLLE